MVNALYVVKIERITPIQILVRSDALFWLGDFYRDFRNDSKENQPSLAVSP